MTDSHLVIDGSNIATEGRSDPSLAQLDEAVQAFTAEHHYDNVVVVVDATFPNRIDPSERDEYEDAINAGEILTPPAGTVGRGDAFVLMIAERSGATILSNDSFQEFHGEHSWLFEDDRLWGGKPVPGVGWVFVERTPVKGPKSKRSTKEARRKAEGAEGAGGTTRGAAKKATSRTRAGSGTAESGRTASGARGSGAQKTGAQKTGAKKSGAKKAAGTPAAKAAGESSGRSRRRRSGGGGGASLEPVNSPADFLRFITTHQPGAVVEAEVAEFTSHGSYMVVDDVRCYLPLKSMGDPPPRSAREVLALGEIRPFIVQEYDAPRRGIVLALPGFGAAESGYRESSSSAGEDAGPTTGPATTMKPAEEASVATTKKKAPAKKKAVATKKAPAKKAPAKKKAVARKAPAKRKAPARRR